MAEAVFHAHGMDKVVFVPAYLPPHKSSRDTAPARSRLEMIRASCQKNELFEVSEIEINAKGRSYTVNTLEALREEYGDNMYFLMGTDSLSEISLWKDYERLFELSNFIVVSRPGISFENAWSDTPKKVREKFKAVGNGYRRVDKNLQIIRSPVKGLDISSTKIRDLLKANMSARYLVTDEVLAYIKTNRIYNK